MDYVRRIVSGWFDDYYFIRNIPGSDRAEHLPGVIRRWTSDNYDLKPGPQTVIMGAQSHRESLWRLPYLPGRKIDRLFRLHLIIDITGDPAQADEIECSYRITRRHRAIKEFLLPDRELLRVIGGKEKTAFLSQK